MKRVVLAVTALASLALVAMVGGSAANLGVTSARLTTFTAAAPPSGDTTAPLRTTLEMFDVNTNGRIDRVVATFDESIVCNAPCTAPWQLSGVPSGGALSSVTVSGAAATLTLTEGVGEPTTAVGSFTVALNAQSTGVRDAAGNQAAFAATSPADKAAPVLRVLELFDVATVNGKVDQVVATFSEALVSTTATAPWSLANVPSAGTLSSVSTSTNQVTLALAEGANAPDTSIGTMTVALTASATGVRDGSLNLASFAAKSPSDKASPHLTALHMLDGDTDGKVDLVEATFSEQIATINVNTGWTLTNVPSGGALATVSSSGPKASLVITEGAGAANTAVGTFQIALGAATSPVKDTSPNANVASFAATSPADKARPVAISLELANGGKTTSKPEADDLVTVGFSEELLASSVCSTGMTDIAGNSSPIRASIAATSGGNARLAVTIDPASTSCGGDVRFGSIDLGSAAYTSATYQGNGSNASMLSQVSSPTALRLKLGSTTGTQATVTGSFTATYTPDSRLSDGAGNFVAGTASHTGTHF